MVDRWLIIVLIIVQFREVATFSQLPGTNLSRGTAANKHAATHVGPLGMVSRKEKQRRQEEEERTAALKQAELVKQQRLLAANLRELQANSSNKHAAHAAHKLLKNTYHDGLLDIGSESRRLFLDIFLRGKRTSDVLAVLASSASAVVSKEEETKLNQFGLWAHSTLKEWKSAAEYASHLYAAEEQPPPISSTRDKHHETPFSTPVMQENLRQWALQAFVNTNQNLSIARKLFRPETDGPQIANLLIQAYRRTGRLDEAFSWWDELDSTLEEHYSPLNENSYRLLLEWGSQAGEIPLMERAMKRLEPMTTASDSMLLLQGLLVRAAKEPLPPKYQTLAVTTFRAIVFEKINSKKKERQVEPELVSQLFMSLDELQERTAAFQVLKLFYDQGDEWISSLQPCTKARILPILLDDSKEEEAWKLLMSLMTAKRASDHSKRTFLKEQSQEFCVVALTLVFKRPQTQEGQALSQMIVEECWEILVLQPINTEAVTLLLEALPSLSPESRYHVFSKVVKELTLQLEKQQSASSNLQQKETVIGPETSFSNPLIDAIVGDNSRLLQALAKANLTVRDYKCLAPKTSAAAMYLIAFDSLGRPSEGRPAEAQVAIHSILTGLLGSDLLSDCELVQPACGYFFALAYLSQRWSREDQRSLLFPSFRLEPLYLPPPLEQDPFEIFRDCMTGQKTAEEQLETEALEILLPSILEMARKADEKAGTEECPELVHSYRRFLSEGIDLVRDKGHLLNFCHALHTGTSLTEDSDAPTVWEKQLWNIQLAKDFVEMVATCKWAEQVTRHRAGYQENEAESIKECVFYLANMYGVVGAFSSLVDEEGNSPGQRYREACAANCRHIVSFVVSQARGLFKEDFDMKTVQRPSPHEMPSLRELRNRKNRMKHTKAGALSMLFWLTFIQGLLSHISHAVLEEDGQWKESYSTMPDGTSSYSMLVADVLDAVSFHSNMDRMDWSFFESEVSQLPDGMIDPKIIDFVKAWLQRHLRN